MSRSAANGLFAMQGRRIGCDRVCIIDGHGCRHRFENSTPSGWILRLVPDERGWVLQVTVEGWENENLARLTPPWHGPNARYLEGWHFRNADNTDPNDGSINQPQEFREFIFSPAVGIDSNTTVAPRRWTLSPGSERSAAGGCSSNRTSSHRRGQANGPRLNH
jgi:hypothetical protein